MPNTTTTISVTGCRSCPMCDTDQEMCNHPDEHIVRYADIASGVRHDRMPEMCPLRSNALTIRAPGDG